MYVIMKKFKLICFCVFGFFPVLCIKGQDVNFNIKKEDDVIIYEVENDTPYYLMLFYTGDINPSGGSYCLVNYEYDNKRRSDFLDVDKCAIRIESGAKYIRKFDISEYVNYKIIDVSAVAAMAVKDRNGKTIPLKLRRNISF